MFRDYDVTANSATITAKIEALTPVKRKSDIETGVQFPLTPPPTVESDTVSLDIKIEGEEITTEINKHFVRRSKRRKIAKTIDDPFGD